MVAGTSDQPVNLLRHFLPEWTASPPALNLSETPTCHRRAVSMPSALGRNKPKGRECNRNIEAFGSLDGPAWGVYSGRREAEEGRLTESDGRGVPAAGAKV